MDVDPFQKYSFPTTINYRQLKLLMIEPTLLKWWLHCSLLLLDNFYI